MNEKTGATDAQIEAAWVLWSSGFPHWSEQGKADWRRYFDEHIDFAAPLLIPPDYCIVLVDDLKALLSGFDGLSSEMGWEEDGGMDHIRALVGDES